MAKLNLSRSEVLAPSDGTLSNFELQKGNYIKAGQAVAALLDRKQLYVVGYFEETKLDKIYIGAPATIQLMGDSQKIKGHVQGIASGIEDRERTTSSGLLANVNPTFSWVRLAQRVPVKNSLIGKKLDDLAAEKVKNVQSDEISEDEKFAKPGDIDLKAQSPSKLKEVNSSYFDKWMTRYEYLIEGSAKPVKILSKNNEEITGAKISNNKLYLPKRGGGEQDITLDNKIKVSELSEEDLQKIAQAAYDKKYNPSKITKPKEENTTPSDGQPQETSKPETDNKSTAEQPVSSDEQATQPNQENDEAFKKELAELDKKLQHEMSIKNQFCFYFCGNIPKDNIMQMFNSVNEQYSNKSISFLNNMAFNEGAFNSYASQLKQDLMNTNAYNNGCCGLYALCVGNIGGRRVKLFYDQNVVLPLKK